MANKYQQIMDTLGVSEANPATLEQLNAIEKQLGYSLPTDYCEFLLDYSDCGFSADIVFPYIKDGYENWGSIFMFYGASQFVSNIAERYRFALKHQNVDDVSYYPGLHLIRSIEGIEEIGRPEELLSIGCDEGGNQICLALFGLRPHAIFYWMNCPTLGRQNIYLLANSFDEFMHLLQHDEA